MSVAADTPSVTSAKAGRAVVALIGEREGRRLLATMTIGLVVVDVLLTLRGQPVGYWMGFYELANEHNPIGLAALTIHPLLFGAKMAVWVIALGLMISRLRLRFALAIAALASIGHFYGAVTWLTSRPPHGAVYVTALVTLLAGAWAATLLSQPGHRTRVVALVGFVITGAACLPGWTDGPFDHACSAALFELEAGHPERGEILVLAEYLNSLDDQPGSSRRLVAASGVATFYESAGFFKEARSFACLAIAEAELDSNNGAVADVTRQMYARVLARAESPLP